MRVAAHKAYSSIRLRVQHYSCSVRAARMIAFQDARLASTSITLLRANEMNVIGELTVPSHVAPSVALSLHELT